MFISGCLIKNHYCQYQKQRNARHYERTATYLFTNKLKCCKCGNFLGGSATTKKNGKKYYYYKCEHCKTRYKEHEIEVELLALMLQLIKIDNLMEEYYTPFIISKATKEVIIIDNYADKTILDMISRIKTKVILITRKNNLLTEIDIEKYEVRKRGKVIELTFREFELLKFLATKSGKIFSRENLLNN